MTGLESTAKRSSLFRHREVGPQAARPLAFQHARRTRSRCLLPLAANALRPGQPFHGPERQSSHAHAHKPRTEGKKHAASEGAHAVHHHTHNRAAEEDEASLKITLLLSLSVGLLMLPWASSHPAFLIAPVLLACTPVVGSGVRPLLKEACLGTLKALKISVGLLPRPHDHESYRHAKAHHHPMAHPQQQQQQPGLPLAREGDPSATSSSTWYQQQQQRPLHADHPYPSSSSSSSPQGPYSPWPRGNDHATQPSNGSSSSSSSSFSSGLHIRQSQQEQVPGHSSTGSTAARGSGSPSGSPSASVDYHDFLEHHDRDPRQLSKKEKKQRHSFNQQNNPLL